MANIIIDFCKKSGYSSYDIPDGSHKLNNKTIIFTKYGQLHRDNGPAYISFSNGLYREQYYIFNILHRDNGPSQYETNGIYTKSRWYKYGKLHREDGPSIENINENNVEQIWYLNGKIHRIDEPSWIQYITNKCNLTNKLNIKYIIQK